MDNVGKELGRRLAKEENVILVNCRQTGTGSEVTLGFVEQCLLNNDNPNSRIEVFRDPFEGGKGLSSVIDKFKSCRTEALRKTDVAVFFAGSKGTKIEVELAKTNNCKLIPVVLGKKDLKNEALREIVGDRDVMEETKKVDPGYYNKILNGNIEVVDIIHFIRKLS